MKKFMMKYLMVNCKEATMLMAKKEERKLSFLKNMQLALHTSMCAICKLFEKQMAKISGESKHIHSNESLPEFSKEKIGKLINKQSG